VGFPYLARVISSPVQVARACGDLKLVAQWSKAWDVYAIGLWVETHGSHHEAGSIKEPGGLTLAQESSYLRTCMVDRD
jgi:hypothetical protein